MVLNVLQILLSSIMILLSLYQLSVLPTLQEALRLSKKTPPSAKEQIRVLCFGASITAGWSSYGFHHYPYASRLSARLADELPTSHFSIEVDGSPGDTAIKGQYMNRIQRDVRNARVPFNWVIIQAGGNDLGWNCTPEQIMQKLEELWRVPLDAGSNVLALTVTEHANATPQWKQRWMKLNSLITDHVEEGFYTADVAAAIPWSGMSEPKRKRIWDDAVHLTKEGYELMGDAIADRLIQIVNESKSIGASQHLRTCPAIQALTSQSDRSAKLWHENKDRHVRSRQLWHGWATPRHPQHGSSLCIGTAYDTVSDLRFVVFPYWCQVSSWIVSLRMRQPGRPGCRDQSFDSYFQPTCRMHHEEGISISMELLLRIGTVFYADTRCRTWS